MAPYDEKLRERNLYGRKDHFCCSVFEYDGFGMFVSHLHWETCNRKNMFIQTPTN